MLPRLLTTLTTLLLFFALCVAQTTSNASGSQNANETLPGNNVTCIPYGACEKCPEEALHQPFCQPFGNRRLMHCRELKPSSADSSTETTPESGKKPTQGSPASLDTPGAGGDDEDLILAWESCGRVVSTERADFFEFVSVNLLFVCASIGVVIWRSRRMQALHARHLAARIGLVGRRR